MCNAKLVHIIVCIFSVGDVFNVYDISDISDDISWQADENRVAFEYGKFYVEMVTSWIAFSWMKIFVLGVASMIFLDALLIISYDIISFIKHNQ